ncbi:MAG: sulfite exporter TauE/SafE family protein [Pseudomonadota bacterium]
MPDPSLIVLICATFFLAGLVKGIVGMGLPTVSLALLAATLGLTQAMALMLVPSLVTNLWQALRGGRLKEILIRFWPFLLVGVAVTVALTHLIQLSNPAVLKALLGLIICLYAGISLLSVKLPAPKTREKAWAVTMGALNGICTGLTGTFVIPSVAYFQSLNLDKNHLVQAMGVWFSVATIALAFGLGRQGLVPADLGLLSALGLVPALLGMGIGERCRQHLSEATFKKVFYLGLMAVGVFILWRAWS